jgi:hypothetical protein
MSENLSIDSKIRVFLIIVLIISGLIFFYLNYQSKKKPQPEKTYWRFKIKEDGLAPTFRCKANIFYTFKSQHGFQYVYAYRNKCHISTEIKSFSISFPEETTLNFTCKVDGVWFKTGDLEIWEGEKRWPVLILVTKYRYSNGGYKLNVKKGMRLNMPKQKEWYYLGYFKNDRLVDEAKTSNDSNYYFRFWDKYELKFKAVEFPFLIEFTSEPFMEKCTVKYGHHNREFMEKIVGDAYFIKPGEVIKTSFWLDKGDKVKVYDGDYRNVLKWSVGNGSWRKKWIQCRYWGYDCKKQYHIINNSTNAGYLKLKAIKHCAINGFTIYHNKKWQFKLGPEQTEKIKIYPGDIIKSESSSRYYVDGHLLKGGYIYTHTQDQERFLKFKGSYDSPWIKVWVVSRRDY